MFNSHTADANLIYSLCLWLFERDHTLNKLTSANTFFNLRAKKKSIVGNCFASFLLFMPCFLLFGETTDNVVQVHC